jgi:hypothetical protein
MCSINLDKEISWPYSSILVSMHYWEGSGVHHYGGLRRHVPYHYQRTDSGVYSHVLGGVGAALPISVMGWIHLHAREREEKKKKHHEEESNSEDNYESDEDDDDFNNSEWELEG